MHLSISNSEPKMQVIKSAHKVKQGIVREIPTKPWQRMFLLALFIVTLLLGAWEWLARTMQHSPGTYQTGQRLMWAQQRQKLDQNEHGVKLILVGSSRMLWAADLNILQRQFGTRPIQLALPGTSPALFVKDIVENTDYDGLMLVGVTPFLFNRATMGAYGRGAMAAYNNKSFSFWAGEKFHNLLSEQIAFLDDGFALFELLEHYPDWPDREGAKKLESTGWKLGNTYQDRQTDMWPPVEVTGSFDNRQVTNFWTRFLSRPAPADEAMEKMLTDTVSFYRPLIQKLRARGGDVIFIRMPSSGRYLENDLNTDYNNKIWLPMVQALNVPAINSMDFAELSSELDIPEWSHLSRDSQDLWSTRVVPHLKRHYQESRGQSIEQLLLSKE